MNQQNQWLFEVPPAFEIFESSFELGESEWEIAVKPRSVRRPTQQPSKQTRKSRSTAMRRVQRIQQNPNSLGKQPTHRTVYGWGQYRRRVEELPADQREILVEVGNQIKNSFQPGYKPIRIAQVYGHADLDTPRNPQREQQISAERARAAAIWLQSYVGQSIATQIKWDTRGIGATQLKASSTSEANRRQNRRVEILLVADEETKPASDKPACTEPSPTQTANANIAGIDFKVLVGVRAFNPTSRGNVQLICRNNKPNRLKFSCHRENGAGIDENRQVVCEIVHAWKYMASIGFNASGAVNLGDWEYGFLQTVDSSKIRHVYSDGNEKRCVLPQRNRDAVSNSLAPWFDDKRGLADIDSKIEPVMEDSPFTIALISHPQTGAKLCQVCLEGVFHLWVAVRNKKTKSLHPLVFKEIKVNRTWTLSSKGDPENTSSWVHKGGQNETKQLVFPGISSQPVTGGSTANAAQAQCFKDVSGTANCSACDDPPEFPGLCIKFDTIGSCSPDSVNCNAKT